MKKKILSFVLAVALALNLGCGSLMASSTNEVQNAASQNAASVDFGSSAIYSANEDGGTTSNVSLFGSALADRVAAVYNYTSGNITHTVDASNNITIYSNGSALATYGYSKTAAGEVDTTTNTTGTWSLINVNISGANLAAMDTNNNGLTVDEFKSFLKKLGATDNMLKYETATSKENSNQVSLGWLDTATTELSKGINHSISIDFTSTKGASLTTVENGKAQKIYAYDGAEIGQYNYKNGFFDTVQQYELELITEDNPQVSNSSDAKENEVVQGDTDGAKYQWKYTTTVYNQYGQADYVKNSSGSKVSQYNYSENGSIKNVQSLANGKVTSTTYYSAGKQSYTTNAEGYTTTTYDYNTNGTLAGITSWNNGTKTTISSYMFGKYMGSADLTKNTGVKTYQELNAAIQTIKKDNSYITTSDTGANTLTGSYANITDIALYKEDLTNTKLIGLALSNNDQVEAAVNYMSSHNNGYSSIGSISFTIDTYDLNDEAVLGSSIYIDNQKVTFTEEDKEKMFEANKSDENDKIDNYTPTWNDVVNYKEITSKTTSETVTADEKDYTDTDGEHLGTYYTGDTRSVEAGDILTFKSKSGKVYTCTVTEADIKAGYDTYAEVITSKLDSDGKLTMNDGSKLYAKTTAAYLTITKKTGTVTYTGTSEAVTCSLTMNDRGAQTVALTGETHSLNSIVGSTNVQSTTLVDPAVVGKVTNVVAIDGVKYAVVDAAKVDILDGNGFQAANGETIYVEVSDDIASSLEAELVSKGSVDFAAAGYIAEDVDGYLTMANVYESAIGKAATTNFINQIVSNEIYQENLQSNIEIFEGYAAENGGKFTSADWKAGWYLLSGRTDKISFNSESGKIAVAF